MSGTTEILVHISAPATRRADDLHRALTDAYLAFEPCRPVRVDRQKSRNVAVDSHNADPGVNTGPLTRDAPLDITDMSVQASGGESFGSFPSHSAIKSQQVDQQSFLSLAVAESIADSFLDSSRFGQLEKIQRRWKQRANMPTPPAGDQGPTPDDTAPPPHCEIDFIESTQFAAQGIESQLDEDLSFLPENTKGSRRSARLPFNTTSAFRENAEPLSADPQPRLSSSWGSSFFTGTIDQGRPPPAEKTDISMILAPISQVTSQLSRDILEESSSNCSQHSASSSLSTLPSEIFAPAPKVSIEAPDSLPTQVTKYLGALLERNPGRFKPSESARPLDRDERGYWSLVCTDWPRRTQLDFWTSLSKHVGAGRWGWGITAHRVPASIGSSGVHSLGEIRVYCWGEVIEHVWLALWLCSKGHVSGSGSKWIDADDSVVIEVP